MRLLSRCCRVFVLAISLGAVAAGAAAAAAAPTPAELEQAKSHFAQGKAFYDQGSLQLARAEFEESYRLSKRPDLLFNLALVAEKLGVFREAADYLMEYVRQRPDAPDRKTIQRSIDELVRRAAAQRKVEQRPQGPAAAEPGPPVPVVTPPAPAPEPTPLARPLLVPVRPEQVSMERSPRPIWRLVTGSVTIAAGIALLGSGAWGLSVDGQCAGEPVSPALVCDRIYGSRTYGSALLGVGVPLMVGGALLLAWPGPRRQASRIEARLETTASLR